MALHEVGEIVYFFEDYVNWKIPPRFFYLIQKDDYRLCSPKFGYEKEVKKYEIAPPGWMTGEPTNRDWVAICLRIDTHDAINCVRVGVTDDNGAEIIVCHCAWNHSYGRFDGIKIDKNFFCRQRLHPNGYLRLFCENPLKPCRQIFDVATQTEVGNGVTILCENIKDLLITKKYTDFTIKVKNREFSVHRLILRARSPVFDAMLAHNLKENNENVVEIEDFEPQVFEEFLFFIYSGEIENITCDNVFGLYYAADKYNLPDLKPACISFMRKNLSLETIFETICLCKNHNERELLNDAVKYFTNNLEEILITCEWLIFLKDNPIEANELYIKALKTGFIKRSEQTNN